MPGEETNRDHPEEGGEPDRCWLSLVRARAWRITDPRPTLLRLLHERLCAFFLLCLCPSLSPSSPLTNYNVRLREFLPLSRAYLAEFERRRNRCSDKASSSQDIVKEKNDRRHLHAATRSLSSRSSHCFSALLTDLFRYAILKNARAFFKRRGENVKCYLSQQTKFARFRNPASYFRIEFYQWNEWVPSLITEHLSSVRYYRRHISQWEINSSVKIKRSVVIGGMIELQKCDKYKIDIVRTELLIALRII